jgi:transposase
VSGAVRDVGDDVNGFHGIGSARRRGSWSADQKAAMVAESLRPGARVSDVAARHGVARDLLSTWRRRAKARKGSSAPGFAAVNILEEADSAKVTPSLTASGVIEVVLADATIRVASDADAATLAMVVTAIRGRR